MLTRNKTKGNFTEQKNESYDPNGFGVPPTKKIKPRNKAALSSEANDMNNSFDENVTVVRAPTMTNPTDMQMISNSESLPPRIRVLSLFDGISTGMCALDELGFDVAAYYVSEIDNDAHKVAYQKFGKTLIQLGCVKNIEKNIIDQIGRIDLLLGGSPCNDLSCVNPLRKGIFDPNGTGVLFFDFYRIKAILDLISVQQNRPYYWMFENVAAMELVNRDIISDFLGCKPYLINSESVSAQIRKRFFWTNLPEVANIAKSTDEGPMLNEYLEKNLGRTANVQKVRTITTKRSCLQDGSSRNPVTENDKPTGLLITEMEKLFGFQSHYTDTGDLSITKRHKLVGRAWSLPVVKAILKPLTREFRTKNTMPDKNCEV